MISSWQTIPFVSVSSNASAKIYFTNPMRISGGKARGIPLRASKTSALRPATEANRERVFSSIGSEVQNKRVLDLFAGTGSYGLEALSRGASTATFVEKNRKVSADLKDNLSRVQKSARFDTASTRIFVRDVVDFLKNPPDKPYDLIFLDPPYALIEELCSPIFSFLRKNQFIHLDSLLFHERPAGDIDFPEGWNLLRTLGKGGKGSPIYHIFKPLG